MPNPRLLTSATRNQVVALVKHSNMDVTIVIPVLNQLHYTRQCLESLNACGCPDEKIVIVNNASNDGTREFLSSRPRLRVIHNDENRACAAAWNQGFQAGTTEWTLFLNNDTVLTPGWLDQLLEFAERQGIDVVSPALGEGELDYSLESYAKTYVEKMKDVCRHNFASGAAFAVRRGVFTKVGLFDENFRKGGNEDDDFFLRARLGGFKLAMTGCAYIHHFGSITLQKIKDTDTSWRAGTMGYFRKKWRINWAKRRWMQCRRKTIRAWWRWSERLRYGHTLLEYRVGQKIHYR